MKTINLELVFDDNNNEDLNIKIVVKKGGEVDVKTLPTSSPTPKTEEKKSTGDGTPEKATKKRSTTTKKANGNMMDVDF